MSQSPKDAEAEVRETYLDGWSAMARLVRQGLSWSGLERNSCFLNLGGTRFADVSAVAGLDLPDDGRSLAVVDWDRDGALDLWVTNRNSPRVRFLRNRANAQNRFVALRLEGRTCNRDAIGARVELVLAGSDRRLVRGLTAGDGFLGQSSKWLHFGLGRGAEIERALVTWPGGAREEFTGLVADRRHDLVQGSGRAVLREPESSAPHLAPEDIAATTAAPRRRALLAARVPLPPLPCTLPDGRAAELRPDGRRALLLSLWASWCPNCLVELEEFGAHAARLEAAGVRVVALSVDAAKDHDAARGVLERLSWQGESGFATELLLDVLRSVEELALDPQRETVLPTSFLIDERFRLAAIYRGPVAVETVLADAAVPDASPEDVRRAAQPFAGRWAAPPRRHDLLALARRWRDMGHVELASGYLQRLEVGRGASGARASEAAGELSATHLAMAEDLARAGRYAQAIPAYRQALQLDPALARAHRGLGISLMETGAYDEAITELRAASELEPRDDVPHYVLGLLYARRDRLDEARAELERALEKNADNSKAHFNLGALHQKQGHPESALACTRRALELDPDYLAARRALAALLHASGDVAAAIPEYERVLAADPRDGPSRLRLGLAQLAAGDRTAAEEQARALEELDPELARRLRAALEEARASGGSGGR